MNERTLLGVGAVARELGVSANTVRRWCDQGRIPCLRTPTGYRRFTRGMVAEMKRTMGYPDEADVGDVRAA